MIARRSALTGLLLVPLAARGQATQAQRREQERLHNDWPYLSRYRTANAALALDDAQVVFLGDSITEGWSDKAPGLFKRGRVNRGISGQTTPQMLVRFRQDVIDLKPRIVHIMAGTNDIAGNTGPATLDMIQANLMSMTELAQVHGIKVILASIPPAKRFPWKPKVDAIGPIGAMNAWLARYAVERGAVYADYFAALIDGAAGMRVGFARDGVHPTAAGYAVMNPIAEQAIATALSRS